MSQEESFGIIPLRWEKERWYVLIVQLRSGNHWGFPKGHANLGEEERAIAERELKEETGLVVKRYLLNRSFQERYVINRGEGAIEKVVTYFVAEVEGELILQEEEVLQAAWHPLEKVVEKLTYPASRSLALDVIKEVEKIT